MSTDRKSDLDLVELWAILWMHRWLIVSITVLSFLLSIPYALSLTERYRVEMLLAPAAERSGPGIGDGLGGLAALAGVSVGGGDSAKPLAILTSRAFLRTFIEDNDLLEIIFADMWDAQEERWAVDDPGDYPDMRDAIRRLQNAMSVREDSATRLVTLELTWTDPVLAAEWANALVSRLNSHMRRQALEDAELNVAYLQSELTDATLVTLQQSIGRLLESELQKLMLARGSEEFSFTVIDPAEVPKERFSPRRTLIVLVATFLGGVLSLLVVFVLHTIKGVRLVLRSGYRW